MFEYQFTGVQVGSVDATIFTEVSFRTLLVEPPDAVLPQPTVQYILHMWNVTQTLEAKNPCQNMYIKYTHKSLKIWIEELGKKIVSKSVMGRNKNGYKLHLFISINYISEKLLHPSSHCSNLKFCPWLASKLNFKPV